MDNEKTRYNKIKEAHPDWSLQDVTKRIKKVVFDKPTDVDDGLRETLELWKAAREIYDSPLVQFRAIFDHTNEEKLLQTVSGINEKISEHSTDARLSIAGRILFREATGVYGIYYLQIESSKRPSYRDEKYLIHPEAVKKGIERRHRTQWELPEGYSIRALDFSGQPLDILTGEKLDIDCGRLAEQIAEVHRESFKFAHDPAQQTRDGVMEILKSNPTLVCFDPKGMVSSVGFMERDSRFTFSDSVLIEPTYFTRPIDNKKGLSSHLRQATKRLTEHYSSVSAYNGKPMIVFNESIRHSSFVLCLENGCNLAGTPDLKISGNLGEAYTAIGPANPETGLMPMGLTYYISPDINPELIGHIK